MAKTVLNSALKSIHGGIDDWVYRQHRGKTVISRRVISTAEPSAAQETIRTRFREAAAYAKSVFDSPTLRAEYETKAAELGMTVFSAAMADYLNPPTVDVVDLVGYHGAPGDSIVVRASDKIGVAAVNVAIRAEDLTVLEEGAATLENGTWVYRATTARAPGQTVTITATALDRPGRTGSKTETWS